MHVLAVLISGGRVTSIKATSSGGSISATKSNMFIALAPYFFPFYTIIVTIVFFLIRWIFKVEPSYTLFLFLIGFTLTFHIVLTLDLLKSKQSDFAYAGYFLSICLIYFMNIIIVGFTLSLLFNDVIFSQFIKESFYKSKDIYIVAFDKLFL